MILSHLAERNVLALDMKPPVIKELLHHFLIHSFGLKWIPYFLCLFVIHHGESCCPISCIDFEYIVFFLWFQNLRIVCLIITYFLITVLPINQLILAPTKQLRGSPKAPQISQMMQPTFQNLSEKLLTRHLQLFYPRFFSSVANLYFPASANIHPCSVMLFLQTKNPVDKQGKWWKERNSGFFCGGCSQEALNLRPGEPNCMYCQLRLNYIFFCESGWSL